MDVGTIDHSDPFERVEAVESEIQDPFERLRSLIGQEATLCARGVTCPLKDRDWSHPRCSQCPERGLVERAELCRVGLAQEETLLALAGSRD